MARLIEIALVVAALAYGWHRLRRHRRDITERLRKAERSAADASETLIKDPKTGIYRPPDRED